MTGAGPAASIVIRPCADDDFAAITAIYSHYVLNGGISFEIEPPDAAEMARRHAAVVAAGLPYLVAEAAGEVLGYAYATPWRARAAYRGTVEDSIYVADGTRGMGVGRALLSALIEACREAGFKQMIGVISSAEEGPSIALHGALGFRMVGRLEKVGYKDGQAYDTVLMQMSLQD